MHTKNIIIIGAGASGLVAALAIAKKGQKVTVLEQNSRVGRKLLATGNGRCNITNSSLCASNYHGGSPSFVNCFLDRFGFFDCKEFFKEIGIEIVKGAQNRYYPISLHAKSVVDALYQACVYYGVEFYMQTHIKKVSYEESEFWIFSEDTKFKTKKLLISTGGAAAPLLGGGQDGLNFAKKLGHTIVPIFPTLVQLKTSNKNVHLASGAKVVSGLQVRVSGSIVEQTEGDLLFTKYGLSGSAILDISRSVTKALNQNEKIDIIVDLFPQMSKDLLIKLLKYRLEVVGYMSVSSWLSGILNPKIVPSIVKIMGWNSESSMPKQIKQLRQLTHHLKNWTISIEGDRGFKSAEVMAGGVSVDEVDNKSMASKICKGLYFSGEVLNIDGDCGGYNLHFAWASGICAGESISN